MKILMIFGISATIMGSFGIPIPFILLMGTLLSVMIYSASEAMG
jgi:hypothetical protein